MVKTTVKIMSVCTTLGDPRSETCDFNSASLQIRRITNIPDNVSSDAALTRFKQTIDATAYGKNGARMEFRYNELGAGKLIK